MTRNHDPDTLRGFAALCRAGLIPPPPPGPRYEIRCDPCGAVLAEGERGHPPDVIHEQPDAHVCPPGPRYPAVRVRLVGDDGNALAIIGAVAAALRREVGTDTAGEWTAAAWRCGSYGALLRLALAWVDVE